MIELNPFNLSGPEAVVASAFWAAAASFIVLCCTKAAAAMTVTICSCVQNSVVAWANASKK